MDRNGQNKQKYLEISMNWFQQDGHRVPHLCEYKCIQKYLKMSFNRIIMEYFVYWFYKNDMSESIGEKYVSRAPVYNNSLSIKDTYFLCIYNLNLYLKNNYPERTFFSGSL